MPQWVVPEFSCEVPRNLALLDTNVLIAFVDKDDPLHENTLAVIEYDDYLWAVCLPALIEAWNFLTGKKKRPDLAHRLMDWALTPGQLILLDDALDPISASHRYSKKLGVDIVDAALVSLADRISKACDFRPAVHVATYDTRDFLRMFGDRSLEFNLYDFKDQTSTAA